MKLIKYQKKSNLIIPLEENSAYLFLKHFRAESYRIKICIPNSRINKAKYVEFERCIVKVDIYGVEHRTMTVTIHIYKDAIIFEDNEGYFKIKNENSILEFVRHIKRILKSEM